MQEDDLDQLAAQFVEMKAPFADAEFKKVLSEEVKTKIEQTINMVLASSLTAEQLDEYNNLLDDDDSTEEELLEFYQKYNVNLNLVMSEALTRFRVAYLGE